MEGFVYHGSDRGDIKVFRPRQATQKGEFVYATPYFELAGIFGFRAGTINADLRCKYGKYVVVERSKDYFKNHDKPIYIYKLDAKDFDYFDEDNWGRNEVRSPKETEPLEVTKYDSHLHMLQEFEQQGKVELFLYPEKPDFLPENDCDLIWSMAQIYAMNPERTYIFDQLKEARPDFTEVIDHVKAQMEGMDKTSMVDYANSLYDFKTKKAGESIAKFFKVDENT